MTRREIAARLLQLTRPLLLPLSGSLVMRVCTLLSGIALLVVAVGGVAEAASGRPPGWRLFGALAALACVKGLTRYLEQYLGHLVAFRCLALLRVHFFGRLERQAPAATEGGRSGDVLARVTRDIDRVEVFFAHTLVPVTAAVVVPVVVVGWVARTDPVSASVLATGLFLLGVAVPVWGSRGAGSQAVDIRRQRGVLAQEVTDSVQGMREVLAFDAVAARVGRLDAAGAELTLSLQRSALTVGVRRGAGLFTMLATMVALVWVGAGRVATQEVTWPDLLMVLAAALGSFPAVTAVEEFMADLDQAFASARRVFEVTEAVPVVAEPSCPMPLPAVSARGRTVSFRQVTFTYPGPPGRSPALEGLDLTLSPGRVTALVGASGAGKSTTAALLLRFWDPDAGRICIDGVSLDRLGLQELWGCVAMVPQRPYVFAASLRENLLLARPGATTQELMEVVAQARLDDLVASLPQGLDTPLGEQAGRLSGGERQRVAIARVLLQQADVVILDEATSQLDGATQGQVQEAMRAVSAGRTVLLIAHRLETVRDAHEIVVLDAGRIVERGTHEELLVRGGAYAAMVAQDDLLRGCGGSIPCPAPSRLRAGHE